MAGFDSLKDEIRRLAKREANALVSPLHDQLKKLKAETRELRATIDEMQKTRLQTALVQDVTEKLESEGVAPSKPRRWSASRFKMWRERSKLTAQEVGDLLGLSSQTIYNYEQEKTRPPEELIAKIAALKEQGKRAVRTLVAAES